jgi:hypothetical protein
MQDKLTSAEAETFFERPEDEGRTPEEGACPSEDEMAEEARLAAEAGHPIPDQQEEAEGLTEEEFAEALGMVLEESGADEVFGDRLAVSSTRSFRDVGMLTMNAGVVVKLSDGSEWQLTVVRSKGPGG